MTLGKPLMPGMIVWADLSPTQGREQSGRRPVLIVSSDHYLSVIDTMAIVVPLTKKDRGWPNHIKSAGPTGLTVDSWVMTEQIRTISRDHIFDISGAVSPLCLKQVLFLSTKSLAHILISYFLQQEH